MFIRRWSLRSKALALLALAAGAGAFTIVRGYAAELEALGPTIGDQVPVVVAARALTRGTEIVDETVRIRKIPATYAPPGAFAALDELVGRTLTSDVAEDEAITRTRVDAGGPVAALLPSGLRAFVVGSGLPSGVVRPGDRVDVIATYGGPHPYADTVGAGLEVLSIVEDGAGTFRADGSSGPSLVLLVSPGTAEALARAQAFGQIAVTIAPLEAS